MYEGYEHLHPIDVDAIDPAVVKTFEVNPYANFLGRGIYTAVVTPWVTPAWHTGWRDETLSWYLTCSFHAGLNPTPAVIIRGPGAKRFLSDTFVNNIERFPIGSSKHGLMLLDDGTVASQGVLMRTGEDEYEANWHSPFLEYRFAQGSYDAELEDVTAKRFLFQLQGPRSLEIVEEATDDDLHGLGFIEHGSSSIAGKPVRVLRFGMANSLGYEIVGNIEDSRIVHKRVLEVGSKYGIRPLGFLSYMMNHTPGGSQQAGFHFMPSAFMDPGFQEFLAATVGRGLFNAFDLAGSAGQDITKRLMNPFELGLRSVVSFNHEFRGKTALEEYAKEPKRTMKTLVWNPDDLADIYRSQFSEEPYRPMDEPGFPAVLTGVLGVEHDLVFDQQGNEIGISGGRTVSHYHRAMLSLASLDVAFCGDGTEVEVLWGEPGTRQKRVRAVVAPMPFNTVNENRSFDVSSIPRRATATAG